MMPDEMKLESLPRSNEITPLEALRFIFGKDISPKLDSIWEHWESLSREICSSGIRDAGRMWILYLKLEIAMLRIRLIGIVAAGFTLFFTVHLALKASYVDALVADIIAIFFANAWFKDFLQRRFSEWDSSQGWSGGLYSLAGLTFKPIQFLHMADQANKLESRRFTFAAANLFSGDAKIAIQKCRTDLNYLMGDTGISEGALKSEIDHWMDSAYANAHCIARTIVRSHDPEGIHRSERLLGAFASYSANYQWDKVGDSAEPLSKTNYLALIAFVSAIIVFAGCFVAGIRYKENSTAVAAAGTLATIVTSFIVAYFRPG